MSAGLTNSGLLAGLCRRSKLKKNSSQLATDQCPQPMAESTDRSVLVFPCQNRSAVEIDVLTSGGTAALPGAVSYFFSVQPAECARL